MPSSDDFDDLHGDEPGGNAELSAYASSPEDGVQLDLLHDTEGNALLYLSAVPTDRDIARGRVKPGQLLAKFHRHADVLETYPLRSYPHEHGFLEPKHDGLVCIVFEDLGFGLELFHSAGETVDAFMALPEGFVKQYQHGLGLYRKNAAIADAVEAIPGVDTLVIRQSRGPAPRVDERRLLLSKDRFDAMRRALERITINYRAEALADAVDPQRFPVRPPRVVSPAPLKARVPTVTQTPTPTGSATRPLPSAQTGSATAPTSHEPD